MLAKTLHSEEARRQWRDMLDTLLARDTEFVIERYSKPIAAVVSFEKWQAMLQRLQVLEAWAEARQAKEDQAVGKGELITWEQLNRLAEVRYGVGA